MIRADIDLHIERRNIRIKEFNSYKISNIFKYNPHILLLYCYYIIGNSFIFYGITRCALGRKKIQKLKIFLKEGFSFFKMHATIFCVYVQAKILFWKQIK